MISGIRKGFVFSLFVGWLYFLSYIVNSIGFLFSAILFHNDNRLTIADILVVRYRNQILKKYKKNFLQ